MQVNNFRPLSTTPPPARNDNPTPEPGPSISDRFVSGVTEGAASGVTGAVTGAVGAHLGMATMVRMMGAPWSASLGWVEPAVITVGALVGGSLAATTGAIHGAAKGEFSYNPAVSAGLGAAVGAGAGALVFTAMMNHATSGAAYFG